MEKLINQIPKTKVMGQTKDGKDFVAGITLRYSVSKDKWCCGYGSRTRETTQRAEADDPVEALAFFVELLNKK